VPPVFIVVCNSTASSKLVYEWVSGWQREREGQLQMIHRGHLGLFSNFDQYGNPLPRMNTLLIDAQQIESGAALDATFRWRRPRSNSSVVRSRSARVPPLAPSPTASSCAR